MPTAAPAIADRLPPEVSRCVLRDMPYDEMREEALDDPRAWNLGRSRAEGPLTDLGLLPAGEQTAYDTGTGVPVDECADVWTAFGE